MRAGYGEHRPIASFDGFRYLASNTDLLNYFGADAQAATEHFVRAGYGEHRPTASFDGFRYLASNTDLIASLGADPGAAARHFVQSGYAAGRPTVSFDPFRYLASNRDLLDYFGPNAQAAAATEHFVRAGFAESRPAAAFDPAQYLANYADLAATFGNDLAAATLQFVRSGHGEGRTDLRLLFQGDGSANSLVGNAAANTLAGGLGNDTLTGGAGADLFVFNTLPDAANNRDTINDFTPGADKLVLDHLVFTLLGAGNLNPVNFVADPSDAAQDTDDFLVYNTATGVLAYDADGNGANPAVAFATLATQPLITAADFAVI